MAVNELRDKARRAFCAIKRNIKIEIPIRIWLKLFLSVIEPVALYGSEVLGPISNNEFTKWDKHSIEILHTEFFKTVLEVQRKTQNNACRAELGQYPLLIRIEKRAIKFYNHLKTSDPKTFHHTALQCQHMTQGKSPLSQLVLGLSSPTQTNPIEPQDSTQNIWPNQIITRLK